MMTKKEDDDDEEEDEKLLVILLSLVDAVMRKNCDEECLFVLKKQVKEQMVEEKVTWGVMWRYYSTGGISEERII